MSLGSSYVYIVRSQQQIGSKVYGVFAIAMETTSALRHNLSNVYSFLPRVDVGTLGRQSGEVQIHTFP